MLSDPFGPLLDRADHRPTIFYIADTKTIVF